MPVLWDQVLPEAAHFSRVGLWLASHPGSWEEGKGLSLCVPPESLGTRLGGSLKASYISKSHLLNFRKS